jgi:hypothetical protein
MATVRHLGLFSLPNIALGTEADFLARRNRCVQPASEFNTTTLDGIARTIAPASLPQSTYTAVSLRRAMLWLWRIKAFSVSASVTVEDETQIEVAIDSFEVTNRKFNLFSTLIETEKEKVCDCGMFYGEAQSSDFEDLVLGSWRVTVIIGALQSMWANYPTTPRIAVGAIGQRVRHEFDAPGIADNFYIPVQVDLFVRGADTMFDYTSGSSTVAAPGEDKNLQWKITDSIGFVSRPFRFGDGNALGVIDITATEYWPYDPEDGLGPIYDSATGAQLRPFPQ